MCCCCHDNGVIIGDLSDLEKQLNQGGVSAHELEKTKKKLEQELEEVRQSLEVSKNETMPQATDSLFCFLGN